MAEEFSKKQENFEKMKNQMEESYGRTIAKLEDKIKEEAEWLDKTWPMPDWLKAQKSADDANRINIAITGSTGAGKSTFSNLFWGRHQYGGAEKPMFKTGACGQTTMEATPLAIHIPGLPDGTANGYDLPGSNTIEFPLEGDKEKGVAPYVKRFGIAYMDFVIIITNARWKKDEVMIVRECTKYHIPFIIVVTKIDRVISDIRMGGCSAFLHNTQAPEQEIIDYYREEIMANFSKPENNVETEDENGNEIVVRADKECLGMFFMRCLPETLARPFDTRLKYDYPNMIECIVRSILSVRGQSVDIDIDAIRQFLKEDVEILQAEFDEGKKRAPFQSEDANKVGTKRKNTGIKAPHYVKQVKNHKVSSFSRARDVVRNLGNVVKSFWGTN